MVSLPKNRPSADADDQISASLKFDLAGGGVEREKAGWLTCKS